MATAKELRAKLVIDAETEGEKSVEALVVDVEKLAAAGGDAAPRLQLLAAELRGRGDVARLELRTPEQGLAEFRERFRQIRPQGQHDTDVPPVRALEQGR